MKHQVLIAGEFELWLLNRNGSVAWKCRAKNGITSRGLDYLASVGFDSTTSKIAAWYAGIINSASFASLASNDTMSAHSGWQEFTNYSGNRPQWVNAESGQRIGSNGAFSFPITANGLIKGMFIVSDSTRGGSNGILWCTAELNQQVNVAIGQTLVGTYGATLASG